MADNVQEKTIITIYDSDIISESMHKINYNFELLNSKYEVDDYKLARLEKALEDKIDLYRRTSDERANGLARDIDILSDMYEGLSSHEEIQALVENAIRNAESSLQGFISEMAGQQVERALAGYATQSYLNTQLKNIRDSIDDLRDDMNTMGNEYQNSSAFLDFMANAEKRLASGTLMAANSTFARNADGYYLYPDNEDGTENPSRYTSLEQFYNDNKSTIDPENKGLDDDTVANAFIALCQRTFKTVYTEMASIRTAVESGVSTVDILTAVQGPDGQRIAGAILMEANNQTGESSIKLNADKIQIDGNHKLKLSASDIIIEGDRYALQSGIVIIHSDNFNLDSNGNVTANNASFTNGSFDGDIVAKTLSTSSRNTMIDELGNLTTVNASIQGDLTAKTLKTNSGNTRIDSDGYLYTKNAEIEGNLTATTLTAANGNTTIDSNGVLHANGADISGSITAEKFSATETTTTTVTDENNVEFTGDLTRNTVIDGNQFLITATGTLESTNSSKNIANSIYIETVDVMDNDNNNIGTTVNGSFVKDQKLYGVPQLRMRYNGMTFALNPSMWSKIEEGGGTVLSNMRWIHQFTGPIYEFNTPQANSLLASYCIQGNVSFDDGNSCTYYLFRPEDNAHSSYKFLTKGITNESIYRLGVDNWGDDKSGNAQLLLSNGLRKNETVGDDLPYYGSYTTQTSLVNHGGMGYTEFGSTTTIEDNYSTYASYLPTSTINCGKKIEETTHNYNNISDNTYGTSNILDVMRNLYKSGIDSYSTSQSYNIWKMIINGSYQDCMITGGSGISLDDYLPYSSNTSTKTASEKIVCYPLSTINNNGLDINDTITTIWVSYSLNTSTTYSFPNNSSNTKYLQIAYQDYIYNNGQWVDSGIKFQPSIFNSNISFDFVMKMNTGIARSDIEIKNKVFECLRKMNIGIFNTDYSKHMNFYKYVKLEAFINSPTFIMFRDSYR